MMRYNEQGIPTEAVMIDFQLTRYSSLGLDLTFFLYTCTEQPVREQHFDSLLNDYHEQFQLILKELGSNPDLITLDDVKKEVKDSGVFGVGMSLEGAVMSLLDEDEVADVDMIPVSFIEAYSLIEAISRLNPLILCVDSQ